MNTKLSTLCFSFLLYMCLRGLLVYMSEFVHYIWNFSWPTKQSLSIRSSAQYSECTVRGSLWQAVDQLYAIFVPEQPCERLFAYETEQLPPNDDGWALPVFSTLAFWWTDLWDRKHGNLSQAWELVFWSIKLDSCRTAVSIHLVDLPSNYEPNAAIQ